MKNKKYLLLIFALAILSIAATAGILATITNSQKSLHTESIAVKAIGTTIAADGSIHSQNEATLHFSSGGKVVYVPFKEGDAVYAGQTIAQLDTYPLQQQLTAALNTYRSTRDNFDQTNDNVTNGILQGQQKANLQGKNLGLPSTTALNADDNLNNIVNNIVKRVVDENQANLDNSVIQVQLANYAMQLATLTSPINGVLLHEDINVAGVMVSPANAFVVVDPNAYVFKANIPAQDIDFVTTGALATVKLTGNNQTYTGTIVRIYPQMVTLPTGANVYQADIQADGLANAAYGQTGTVTIASTQKSATILVPTWTIVGHNRIWLIKNNKPVLQTVAIGNTHGDYTEVVHGLSPEDKVITNPKAVAAERYLAI